MEIGFSQASGAKAVSNGKAGMSDGRSTKNGMTFLARLPYQRLYALRESKSKRH